MALRLLGKLVALGLMIASGTSAFAQAGSVEVGELDGVPYRVDIPDNWNHSLVVFYHGYSLVPDKFNKADGPGAVIAFTQRGYATVRSAYSTTGWALAEGFADTEKLRKDFAKKHGEPKETFVAGHSMGGALTMMTMERNPGPYTGALDLCGAVVPANEWAQRRFALLAAFEFYFPGLLPDMVPAPVNYVESPEVGKKLLDALKADPADAEKMRHLTSLYRDEDVAHLMQYIVFQISDFSHKAGGNVVDTANFILTGSGSAEEDFRLNDGVKRYSPDPAARKWMIANYSGTGKLAKPMLALHTVYDTLIPATSIAAYAERVTEAGSADHFVQQYVDHIGHCAFTPDEVGRAFDELVGWTHGGPRPAGGKLP